MHGTPRGSQMNTIDFFQYLVGNDATRDLAAELASAYLQRRATPARAAA
jgi:hypothetical protein